MNPFINGYMIFNNIATIIQSGIDDFSANDIEKLDVKQAKE